MVENSRTYNVSIAKDLSYICSPLEKNYGITLIAYRRFYSSGGLLYLFNHTQWMDYCYINKCWSSISFHDRIKHLSHKSTLYYTWPEMPVLADPVYCALYEHNIWNGMIIYKKYRDCLETYAFASSVRENNNVKNIYLYQPEILEHFISYFKDKIFSLLPENEKKILLPCHLNFNTATEDEERKKKFIQETSIKHFYLRRNGFDVRLTKREEECIALLSKGKKIKEIGRILKISARTVESYLNNLTKRCQSGSKNQLIHLYQENRQQE